MHLKSLNALRWENPPANLDDSMVPTMENSLYKWGMSHGHWGMFAGNFLGIFQHFESIRIKVSWIHGDVTIRSGGFVPGSQGNAEKNVFFFFRMRNEALAIEHAGLTKMNRRVTIVKSAKKKHDLKTNKRPKP